MANIWDLCELLLLSSHLYLVRHMCTKFGIFTSKTDAFITKFIKSCVLDIFTPKTLFANKYRNSAVLIITIQFFII